ncbi:TerB family tellurite resistance protein [Fertoebacter nigrum]|uniref:TerB family tellurite resistance protein n=1 Tax=Fertoeibacter niger TaxID=2656921 RepID=A0A8X8KQI7_9RHOB|nr:TerB family tellurite resistance protein [Fertoeibacter niger]NUB44107.1 TerB family tellurite resistance protein [Fertoeibacter niger]
MLDNLLRRLLAPAPARLPEPDARVALAALLVRIARADGRYDPAETARIDRVLANRNAMSAFEAAALRREAEALEAEAPDTVRFTRALKDAVARDDRAALMQALWAVALADGQRDDDEDQLLRLVASLLGLTDQESALARQRAAREA